MDKIPVNDGGGLYDSIGMIESLIVDCNTLTGLLIENRFVAYCSKVVEMVQKLSELKAGVKNDIESCQKQIKELLKEAESGV